MTFWFYIRSLATNGVVSCSKECHEFLRSQVIVEPFDESDSQLWCWDGQFLRNKHTDLVLDIRKGRLRIIQDTEICLYSAKDKEDWHNQLWAAKSVNEKEGLDQYVIHSFCNDDWTLEIGDTIGDVSKLILSPFENSPLQHWQLVPEGQLQNQVETPSLASDSSSVADESFDYLEFGFAHPLCPAKRGSNSSLFSLQ